MVNFKSLGDKAKDLVEKRGGTDSLKEDAGEVKDIFKGKGSITDKAKAAAAAIKDPGAEGESPSKPGADKAATAAGSSEAPVAPPKEAAGDAKVEAAEKTHHRSHHKDHPGEAGGAK